jgi:hypothetical protein
VTPCVTGGYQHFRGSCSIFRVEENEAAFSSEMLGNTATMKTLKLLFHNLPDGCLLSKFSTHLMFSPSEQHL